MISFRLLGVPDLRSASGTKALTVLSQAKHVALLAILCVARTKSVRRERLLSLLWADVEETRARNSLSKAIHNCRRALGDDAIGGRFAEEIALDVSAWTCDLWDLDDAQRRGDQETVLTIALTGEFLDGLVVPDSAAMEHWLDGERARIRRTAVEAASDLALRDETVGNLDLAIERLRIAAVLSPLDERILRRRISIIDRAGDRAGALERFAEFKSLLQNELEVDPAPETLALVQSMRQRERPANSAATAPFEFDANSLEAEGASRSAAFAALTEGFAGQPADILAELGVQRPPATVSPQPESSGHITSAVRLSLPIRYVGALTLLGAALAGTVYSRSSDSAERPAAGRVIVTPFVNQTNDTALAPIGELAADMLGAALSRAGVADVADARTRMRKGLSVASPTNGGDVEELAERANRAGYQTIITGRYYVTNGNLTVIAQLRSASSTTPLVRFAEEEGSIADPVQVLRRVEQRLLGAFATLQGARMAAASTSAAAAPTYAAYVEYVGGLKPWIDGDASAAAAHFERAFRLDSGFVSVVPLLYEAWFNSGRSASAESLLTAQASRQSLMAPYDQAQLAYIRAFDRGDRESMYEATQRMVRLAPHSPDAQWSHGFAAATTNRFEAAVKAFDAAELDRWWTHDKLFPAVHWQSITYHLLGRHTDELALVRAIIVRHPFEADACMYQLRAMAPQSSTGDIEKVIEGCIATSGGADTTWRAHALLMIAGEMRAHDRPREALQFAGKAVALFRDALKRDDRSTQLREGLCTGLMELGHWEEALALLEPVARAIPDNRPPRFAANTAIAAAKLGRIGLSNEMLARISDSTPTSAFHLQRARVLAHLGRTDEAIAELRAAISKGLSATELFHANLGLEPLRRLPAYDALVRPRQ